MKKALLDCLPSAPGLEGMRMAAKENTGEEKKRTDEERRKKETEDLEN